MRQIKFRGKTNTLHYVGDEIKSFNNQWVYGYLVFENQRYKIQDDNSGIFFPVNPDTVGQFTGLKDKNGVDIYEGDVIELTKQRSSYGSWKGQRFTIEYDHFKFCGFGYKRSQYSENAEFALTAKLSDGCIVIGNIHK